MSSVVCLLFGFSCWSVKLVNTQDVKVVQACPGTTVTLGCPADSYIEVNTKSYSLYMGISSCVKQDARGCACREPPTEAQIDELTKQCNGRTTCQVQIEPKKIYCGIYQDEYRVSIDYERIEYSCIASFKWSHVLIGFAVGMTSMFLILVYLNIRVLRRLERCGCYGSPADDMSDGYEKQDAVGRTAVAVGGTVDESVAMTTAAGC